MRDRAVSANGLQPLFEPRSIALVGASRKEGSLGRRALRHVIQHGYRGEVHLVHPTADELEGVRAVRSIAEIDPTPDLAFVCTDGNRVLGVIEEAVDAGVPAVAAIAASGAIIDERDAVRALLERGGARMLGPNAPGFLSVNPPVAPHISNFLSRPALLSAPIGLITHSGAVGGILGDHLLESGVGLDWLIDVGMGECLEYLAGRELRAIGLFVEAVRDLDAFRRGLDRAAEHGIEVLAVKVGRSAAGARQALTHTGALTGDSALFEQELVRRGGHLCENLEQLAACLAMATLPPAPTRSLAVAAASGGMAGLLGDLAMRDGIAVPDLGDLANPWDTDVQIIDDPEGAARVWRAMLERGDVGAGLMGFGSLPDASMMRIAESLAAEPVDKPTVLVPAAGMPVEMMELLRGRAVSIADSAVAIAAIDWWTATAPAHRARTDATPSHAAASVPPPRPAAASPARAPGPSPSRAPGAPPPGTPPARLAIDEAAAKQVLREASISVPLGLAVESVDDALAFAADAKPPFVLKCLRPALAHKAAAGGVALGLRGAKPELRAAWDAMTDAVRNATGEPMRAALIEEQATPGLELIVSAGDDPDYGPFLTLGAGGGEVERRPDVAHRLLPVDDAAVHAALAELRLGSALRQAAAARGENGSAPAALVALILSVAELATERPGTTIELNPVIVPFQNGGPIAVDCVLMEEGT
jgi:acyl-CoA synthetase (NDP forming)